MTYLKSLLSVTGLTAAFVAGCGSAAMPLDKLTDAKSTVRAAQEAGAEHTPQAQLHLKMANDELASAQKAINDNDQARAQLLLNQAQSDADLAVALARGTTQERAAQTAQSKVVDLSKQAQ
jgi:pyridoxal biosynthesis lyase PdxS